MDLEKLKHKLKRLTEQRDALEKEHIGKELNFTYWGGYRMGELKGKISILEDVIDDLTTE